MKKLSIYTAIVLASLSVPIVGTAQVAELQQLILNIEKLTQFKQILSDMKKGYQIVSGGYGMIKDLSEGNFSLHKTFLDGLLSVSPAVRNYKRVPEIIASQVSLVKEYKRAFGRFRDDGNFNVREVEYMGKVYEQLFNQSLRDLDDLATIVTAGKLRMSDDERLKAIDDVYERMSDKLLFLRHFNNQTALLSVHRAREKNELSTIENLYGIKK